MTRAELLEAASMKLAEVVLLLAEAGEKRLACALPLQGKVPPTFISP